LSNDQLISNTENITLLPETSKKATLKSRLAKIISHLKPAFLNILLSFVALLITLAFSQRLLLALVVALGAYLSSIFLVQPFIKNKQFYSFLQNPFKRRYSLPRKLPTNNQTVILYLEEKTLTAISLLKAKWFDTQISLRFLWDFFMEEGIFIQDCREGCYIIIQKQQKITSSTPLQEEATKLVKEIEKTVYLTKRKFELSFDNIILKLVKGQEEIKTILHLGLSPEKFLAPHELAEEEILAIKRDSLTHSDHYVEGERN